MEGAAAVPPVGEKWDKFRRTHLVHFGGKWPLSREPIERTVACMREVVTSPQIAPPAGPYSHAVIGTGDLVYLSGQTGQDPSTGEIVSGGVGAETRQVFANLLQVLNAAGLDFAAVVKCTVFLVDMADFGLMNAVYAEVMPGPYPARSTVAVAALALGARVEIECVAAR